MKKYTANYAYTNPNFVIQNLVTNDTNTDLLPILYVLKNILQRGFPTTLSKYLQSKIGSIHEYSNFEERFLFATNQTPIWIDTIRGDKQNNYYPAKIFFEEIIPNEFGEFAFVQSLIIPEILINDITGVYSEDFTNQQVDFYLPQAKLVIEIDGQQHKLDDVTRVSDQERDLYLSNKGITTIRISTRELQDGSYNKKVELILMHLARHESLLNFYKSACEKIEQNRFTSEEFETKLLPTAIIRFQILIIELLIHNYLSLNEEWKFHILTHEDLGDFAELAIKDTLIWIDELWQLKNKTELIKPSYQVVIANDKEKFFPTTRSINVDFSLFKRYTDENLNNEDIIFVRTDYFDIIKDRNYFRVSTTDPINYNISDVDKPHLEFFLKNIFDKASFREGQFPIISNALNRKDTIGLLPTGGGKSICYQLPCLLQPSINVVVCPIKSLMYDQNDNLQKTLVTNVNFITSDMGADEKRDVEFDFSQGRYLLVWISPEKFQIPSFRDKVCKIVTDFSMAYAVIDEVHCLSEWGHDFRTSYLNLAKTIDQLSPKDDRGEGMIKFIGLTATASVNVLNDIKIEFSRQKDRLEEENIKSLLDYSRKELQFTVINDDDKKSDKLLEIIEEFKISEQFTENNKKAGIVFTPNVNGTFGCYTLANRLNVRFPKKVGWFSGDIPKANVYNDRGQKIGTSPIMQKKEFDIYKQQTQKAFKENKIQLLAATKAFGMGIDKQNVYYTFHYGLPSSVESFYQEAGRAGRWDTRLEENANKMGKCFVLHSHEVCDSQLIEKLFHKDTTVAEIKEISKEVGFSGKDLFKQIFLLVQGQNDIFEEFVLMMGVLECYFQENKEVNIFWKEACSRLSVNLQLLEKVIYRLSLLGIVEDWTTNFINHFTVSFNSLDEKHIIRSLASYITKYEPNSDVKSNLEKTISDPRYDKCISDYMSADPRKPKLLRNYDSVVYAATWFILNWTFENISYTRRQSLKTIYDWCLDFKDSASFKKRIDSYFVFSETTFIIQHIAENPLDYIKWFEVLTINNQLADKAEYEKLKDAVSRFLESYRNAIGLNFVSGFVRLVLGEYDDNDGKERFENALSQISDLLKLDEQEDLLIRLKILGGHLSDNQKIELFESVVFYFPEKKEEFADHFGLDYLLNDLYLQKIQQLKTLNNMLYEQFTKIQ